MASLLTVIADEVTSTQKFILARQRSITQAGFPGQELIYQSDTEVIAFRAFLRPSQVYVIGAGLLKVKKCLPEKRLFF
jgi:hypothetical protein